QVFHRPPGTTARGPKGKSSPGSLVAPVVGAPLLLALAGHTQAALPHRRRRADGAVAEALADGIDRTAGLVPQGAAEVVEAELLGGACHEARHAPDHAGVPGRCIYC